MQTVSWLLPWGNAKCSHLCAFSQTYGDRLASRCPSGHLQRLRCHHGALHKELALGRGCGRDEGPRGEQDHKHGVCNGLGSLVGSPRGQQDPCSLKNSSPEDCAPGLSPPPATQVTPVSWTRGERSALEGEDPPLLTRSHLPTGEILAEGSVSALSRALGGKVRLLLWPSGTRPVSNLCALAAAVVSLLTPGPPQRYSYPQMTVKVCVYIRRDSGTPAIFLTSLCYYRFLLCGSFPIFLTNVYQ